MINAKKKSVISGSQRQKANVATRNSSLRWQFGKISAQEHAVPLTVNLGPAAIYYSGLICI